MKPKVDNRDFVVSWVTADNVDDVVKATGMTKEAIRERVKSLRKRGVQLRELPNVAKKEQEVKELNQLVTKYSPRDKSGMRKVY